MEPPYVVKPVNEGSSVGVFIIRKGDNRPPAANWPATNGTLADEMMVEEFVPGRELTVAVMGGKALGVTEITTNLEFYDYEAKYAAGGSRHVLPAKIPEAVAEEAMRLAERAHAGARLPRRVAHRFPLRRHRRQASPDRARNQHPARHDADLAGARTGRPYRHELRQLCRWIVEDASCDR